MTKLNAGHCKAPPGTAATKLRVSIRSEAAKINASIS
jgi:hypothetical protein